MSTNQTFSPVGIAPPFKGFIPDGSTVLRLLNSTDGAAFTAGEVVELVPEGTDATTLTSETSGDFVDMTAPTVPAATDAGSNVSTKCYGVLLEDTADDAFGLVLTRGELVVANVDGFTGTAIDLDDALYIGGAADLNRLANVEDLAVGETVKVIARARNATQMTSATGQIAVLFNGIEGFGTVQGLA